MKIPLIITGPPRCGTSRLNLCLNSHPQIFTFHELSIFTNWTSDKYWMWLSDCLEHDKNRQRYFKMNHINITSVIDCIRRNSFNGYRMFRYLSRLSKNAFYIGDKNPQSYLISLKSLLDTHKNAKAIVIIRDGRGVIASSISRYNKNITKSKAWWMKPSIDQAESVWLRGMNELWSLRKNPRVKIVKFEDMLLKTKELFTNLKQFLSLTSDFHLTEDIISPSIDKLSTGNSISKKALSPLFKDYLHRWGYIK